MSPIKSVAIVGGTHGNEFSGIYLVKKWQQQPELIQRSSLKVETLFANPQAFAANKRYLDGDLNRQFRSELISDPTKANYEQSRAKAIDAHIGPKGNARCDFVIDLHNTTANMGPCVILVQQHPLYNLLAGYLTLKMPEVTITRDEDHLPAEQHHLLATTGTFGVIIEVGPQSQSVIRHDVYVWMETLTAHILDFLDLYNTERLPRLPTQVEAYRFLESITLPMDNNGERLGMVHRNVQDRDFQPIQTGDPLFMTFAGETITYQGEQTVYPCFINEAAYYDNNLAMSLMEKVNIDVYGG